jgi:hypothetical protein
MLPTCRSTICEAGETREKLGTATLNNDWLMKGDDQ